MTPPSPNPALFPVGRTVQLSQMAANPYPTFAALHASKPVSWIESIDMWYVVRRADVLRVLADPDTFTVVSGHSLVREAVGHNMLTTDGDEQYRLRRPFLEPFAPRSVKATQADTIHADVRALIEAFVDQGEADLKTAFADPLAVLTLARTLGLGDVAVERVRGWVTAFNHVMSNYHGDEAVRAAGRTANDDLAGYVRARFAELRATPDDSVLGAMVAAHNGLTERELIDAARVIIFGGVETTSALITNALWALLTHPEQLAVVREDESLLPNAIEEALRWEAPVQTCTRHVTRDVEIGGITLRKGDTLQCMLGAANRDPAHYDAPDVFDVRRENARSSVVCEWEALLHRGGAGAVGGGGRVGDAVRTVTGVAGGRSSGGPSAGDGLPCAGAVAGGVGNITMKAKSKGEKVRAWPYIRNTLIGLAILATLCGLPAAYFAISEFMADGVSALYLPAQDCSPVGGFTANGVVQDEAGNPIANAPVRVWQTGDWRPMRATTFTDNTGAFEVTLTGSWSCYKVGIEVRTRGYREWQTIYFVPDPSWDWPDELPATVVVTLER